MWKVMYLYVFHSTFQQRLIYTMFNVWWRIFGSFSHEWKSGHCMAAALPMPMQSLMQYHYCSRREYIHYKPLGYERGMQKNVIIENTLTGSKLFYFRSHYNIILINNTPAWYKIEPLHLISDPSLNFFRWFFSYSLLFKWFLAHRSMTTLFISVLLANFHLVDDYCDGWQRFSIDKRLLCTLI